MSKKENNTYEDKYGVLIVDDEPIICARLRDKIPWEQYGIEVVGIARNGLEAIELIRQKTPDIVLTDIRMPGMDGLDLASWSYHENNDIEVILLTGYSDFEYAQKAIRVGVSEYLLKPLDKDELFAALDKAVKKIKKKRKSFSNKTNENYLIYDSLMTKIKAYIDINYAKRINLKTIAAEFNTNPSYISRAFTQHYGVNYSEYINCLRLRNAEKLLTETGFSISGIATASGYPNKQYFCRIFKKNYGITPSEFRSKSSGG